MPFLNVNGCKLFFETSGDGPPLVLLHGLGSSQADWQLQTPVLAGSFCVIAPDLRGHGKSDKPSGPYSIELFAGDVAAILTHLDVKQAHVLGVSMGGLVAQQLALDSPETVKSLVLINTFSHLVVSGLGAWLTVFRRILTMQFLSMARIGQLVARQLFPKPEQEMLRQITAQRWALNDRAAYRAAARAVWRFDVAGRLGEITCPTLIIAGENDTTVLAPHREALHQGIVGSRLVIIPDSTHATPVDQPEVFNRTVLEFLASIDPL
jgi:3-oxoadipate enol-lactonase